MLLEHIIRSYTKGFKVRLTDSVGDMSAFYSTLARQHAEIEPLVFALHEQLAKGAIKSDAPIWQLVRNELSLKDLFAGVLGLAIDTSDPAKPRLVNTGTDAELVLTNLTLNNIIAMFEQIKQAKQEGQSNADSPEPEGIPDPDTLNS